MPKTNVRIDLKKIKTQCQKNKTDLQELALLASVFLGRHIPRQRLADYLEGKYEPKLGVFTSIIRVLDPEARLDDYILVNGK